LIFINLLVRVIYLVVDNIKRTNLTQNMKIKKCWLREQDLNQQLSGYGPDVGTLLRIKRTQHLKDKLDKFMGFRFISAQFRHRLFPKKVSKFSA